MALLTAVADLCSGVSRRHTAGDRRILPPDICGALTDVPHVAAANMRRHRGPQSCVRPVFDRQARHPRRFTKRRSTRRHCDHAGGPSGAG
ncbi:hypothetical protein KL921_002017 [Ogataea angusta]|nr:hypothetical protein KL921_002017 [Ogataea angusta]